VGFGVDSGGEGCVAQPCFWEARTPGG